MLFSLFFSGKGIIIGILLNLRLAMTGKTLRISHLKHMRYNSFVSVDLQFLKHQIMNKYSPTP